MHQSDICGAYEEIRTPNICVLSAAPLPIGLRKHLMVLQERFELSPLQGLNLMSLPVGRLEHTGIPERARTSNVTALNRKRVPFRHGGYTGDPSGSRTPVVWLRTSSTAIIGMGHCGASEENRTPNLMITNQLLYLIELQKHIGDA